MKKMLKENITAGDGTELVGRKWLNAESKADLLYVHGFQEYAGRYEDEALFINKAGIDFYSYDQRTHGESGGPLRSYIDDFNLLVDDLALMIRHFGLGQNRPLFLLGHSMGGLVVLSHILDHPDQAQKVRGVLMSAPLLMPKADMSPLLQKLSGIMARVAPRLKTIKLDVNEISRDPQERKNYMADPFIYHDGIYAASGAQLLKQMKKCRTRFKSFSHPIIIQHSKDDQITEFEGSRQLIEHCISNDKTMVELEEFKHEILKDIGHEKVLTKFSDWILERL